MPSISLQLFQGGIRDNFFHNEGKYEAKQTQIQSIIHVFITFESIDILSSHQSQL